MLLIYPLDSIIVLLQNELDTKETFGFMEKITYLESGLDNGHIIRWSVNCMPIKFFVAPCTFYSVAGVSDKYMGMVLQALKDWEAASNNIIKFQLVNSLNDSQINLLWRRVNRESLGHCYYHHDNSCRLYSAEIEIGISDGYICREYMKEDEVYHTIVHEIGHSIGLGHSPFDGDIMYVPHKYGVTKIGKNDKETLKWLYNLPFGATAKDIAKKYSQPELSLDELVFKISKKGIKSDFEKIKDNIHLEKKDLLEEQYNIAKLKQYKLSLQNIELSEDAKKYVEKELRKKHF